MASSQWLSSYRIRLRIFSVSSSKQLSSAGLIKSGTINIDSLACCKAFWLLESKYCFDRIKSAPCIKVVSVHDGDGDHSLGKPRVINNLAAMFPDVSSCFHCYNHPNMCSSLNKPKVRIRSLSWHFCQNSFLQAKYSDAHQFLFRITTVRRQIGTQLSERRRIIVSEWRTRWEGIVQRRALDWFETTSKLWEWNVSIINDSRKSMNAFSWFASIIFPERSKGQIIVNDIGTLFAITVTWSTQFTRDGLHSTIVGLGRGVHEPRIGNAELWMHWQYIRTGRLSDSTIQHVVDHYVRLAVVPFLPGVTVTLELEKKKQDSTHLWLQWSQ